jgi:hypothetical protein
VGSAAGAGACVAGAAVAGACVAGAGVAWLAQEAIVNKQTNTKSREIRRFMHEFLLKLFGALIITRM